MHQHIAFWLVENVDDVVNENNELRMLRTYSIFFLAGPLWSVFLLASRIYAVDRKSVGTLVGYVAAKRDGITTLPRDDLECV